MPISIQSCVLQGSLFDVRSFTADSKASFFGAAFSALGDIAVLVTRSNIVTRRSASLGPSVVMMTAKGLLDIFCDIIE